MQLGQTSNGKQNKKDWTSRDWADNGFKEADLQSWMIKELEKISKKDFDCLYIVKVMKGNKRGTPDIILSVKGKFVAMELKRHVERPTTLQVIHMNRIKFSGGIAGVVRCWDDAVELCKKAGYDLSKK